MSFTKAHMLEAIEGIGPYSIMGLLNPRSCRNHDVRAFRVKLENGRGGQEKTAVLRHTPEEGILHQEMRIAAILLLNRGRMGECVPEILGAGDILAGENAGFFTLFEWVEGQKIEIKERDYEAAVFLAKGILKALKELHAKDLVHRDIKLDNVILAPNNQIRIIDLDLVMEKNARTSIILRGDTVAPELRTSESPIGPAADLYGLGCIIERVFNPRLNSFTTRNTIMERLNLERYEGDRETVAILANLVQDWKNPNPNKRPMAQLSLDLLESSKY